MRATGVAPILMILCSMLVLATGVDLPADTELEQVSEFAYMVPAGETALDLPVILSSISPISRELLVRRNIAQATFCLPQNLLGILFHGLLRLTGVAVETATFNEMTVVMTRLPVGVSLGKTIFLHTSLQTENAIRHEYGHTMQGYKRGPFFLLCEGAVSFAQAIASVVFPSFADGYFERWPEYEANRLGGDL